MKRTLPFFAALFFVAFILVAASLNNAYKADDVIGEWYTDGNKSLIQIYKNKYDYYFGKIIWLKDPNENGKPKVDKENPDPKLKDKPLEGLIILRSFRFEKDKWTDGTIYDPENGKTYKCTIRLEDINTMGVRGYIGVSAIGRTTTWKRKTTK
jgi:uncharacterized protein (DUF2147 family)